MARAAGFLFFAGAALVACRPAGPGALEPLSGAIAFRREISPFPVADQTGSPFDEPFLGGFNIPRPQFVDIDGDGDLDLFLQEVSNRTAFFESVGAPQAPAFRWRTDAFHDLDVGEWYRFVDLDGDGDYDLLAEQPFSYIRLFRNVGSPREPRFTPAIDSLRDDSGAPLFSDRQNIPTLIDLDCNDRLDLFLGRLTGTVSRYELVDRADTLHRFRLVADRFEDIEIISQFGSMHGANTMAIGDVDQDGDADLFWGDFFEPGVLFIENHGTCAAPALRGTPVPFPPDAPILTSGYNAPALADLDGDGDLDLFLGVVGGAYNALRTSIENFHFVEQLGAGRFAARTSRFIRTLDVGSESIPALVDLDGDGDLDLLISNKLDPQDLRTSRIYHFENVGSSRAPAFRDRGPLSITGAFHYAPGFGDLDGDGDLDLLLGSWQKDVRFYRNDGNARSPAFVLADSAMVTLTRGSNTTPALADLDGDGDLDLFVGEASGTLNYYRNVGTRLAPRFELVSDEFGAIDVGRRSAPALVDLDGDGAVDLLVGTEDAGILWFRGRGPAADPVFDAPVTLGVAVTSFAAPAAADLNGDGSLELLVGVAQGGLLFFRGVSARGAR